MKKQSIIICIILLFCFSALNAASPVDESQKLITTIGVLQGGGSIVGVDLEFKIADHWGVQAGFGYVGLGAGINYHFKPYLESSALSLQFWNQGGFFGYELTQRLIGGTYIFRIFNWLSGQIGMAYTLERGAEFQETLEEDFDEVPDVILMYSLGVYF